MSISVIWSGASDAAGGRGFDVSLRNESMIRHEVGLTKAFFCGSIFVVSPEGDAVMVQSARFHTAIRVGPRLTNSIMLNPGEAYTWHIDMKEIVGPNGEKVEIDIRDGARILCVSEAVWFDCDGNPHKPAVIVAEVQ